MLCCQAKDDEPAEIRTTLSFQSNRIAVNSVDLKLIKVSLQITNENYQSHWLFWPITANLSKCFNFNNFRIKSLLSETFCIHFDCAVYLFTFFFCTNLFFYSLLLFLLLLKSNTMLFTFFWFLMLYVILCFHSLARNFFLNLSLNTYCLFWFTDFRCVFFTGFVSCNHYRQFLRCEYFPCRRALRLFDTSS